LSSLQHTVSYLLSPTLIPILPHSPTLFFFTDTATTEIYTLSLHDALPISREHHLTHIAVLEKGWIGGGNTGRNTTIIRSNYLFDESAALYDHAVRLWEHLSQVLKYNVMFSQRGVMMLAHTVHDAQVFKRHVHANRVNG